jgi:uncharacterized protein with HEPN domain
MCGMRDWLGTWVCETCGLKRAQEQPGHGDPATISTPAPTGGTAAATHIHALLDDRRTMKAVAYSLQVMGEPARGVSLHFRASHPEVPWAEIIGMRHRIAHEYGAVSFRIVRVVALEELPSLRAALARVLYPRDPSLDPQLAGQDTGDSSSIRGDPTVTMANTPEIPGGKGTCAGSGNYIPLVNAAPAGMHRVVDMPIPRFWAPTM